MKATFPSTAGLRLFTSNGLETLVGKLAEIVSVPLPSPLQTEIVIVQSQGMARWLQLELARRIGLCANFRFPFPKAFVSELFHMLHPAAPGQRDPEPAAMVWALMQLLPDLAEQAAFAPIRHYLARDPDGRKLFQLAGRLARLFDEYLIYRPDLLLGWAAGEDPGWQAVLWREAQKRLPPLHPPALRQQCLQELQERRSAPAGLPPRLSIFGISALPPFQVDLFDRLGSGMEVNLFLLQPAMEYWGDISSARRRLHRSRVQGAAAPEPAPTPSELHEHAGNRLLASLGNQGRDFLNVLLTVTEFNTADEFADPGTGSMLTAVQSDILHLRNRGVGDVPQLGIPAEDDSIQVHSCHSPLRELEVLQDRLLDWFMRDPGLKPRDVLVLVPDIETYAPFVEAVFSASDGDPAGIPYSLADRGSRFGSQVVSGFLAILNLAGGRLGLSSILTLLENPAVRRRFDLEESDLLRIRHWLENAGVRWGRDAAHRSALELPAFPENSWRHGLDRLLLGYALSEQSGELFGEMLPCDAAEGQSGAILGRLATFVETLFATLQQLDAPRPLPAWIELLRSVMADFFAEDEITGPELLLVRSALAELERHQRQAAFEQPVSLAVILESLTPALEEDRAHGGFLTGRVTFAALKPMRSIPFKAICLVGMNDSSFPRADNRLSFDLMAAEPRLGDQSKREDDRYLFLETLLSARQKFYLSYVGQSIRDNSVAPPSVLVSELIDYLRQAFTPAGGGDLIDGQVCFRHRLQAFSNAYFQPHRRLFSYSQDNFRASTALRGEPRLAAFIEPPLPAPDADWRNVRLDDLAEFFAHPARYFVTRRLDLRLPRHDAPLEENEPMELDARDRYELKSSLLEHRLAGGDPGRACARLKAAGRLPGGRVGAAAFHALRDEVENFHRRLEPFQPHARIEAPELDVVLGAFRLQGGFAHVTPSGLLQFRPARIRPRDKLRAWIRHLAWNTVADAPAPPVSIIVGEPVRSGSSARESSAVLRFRPVRQPAAILGRLLDLYWRGLSEPLAFFPDTSHQCAEAAARNPEATVEELIAAVRDTWEGNDFAPGDQEDDYCRLCFAGRDPLDAWFVELARAICGPMLEQVEELP